MNKLKEAPMSTINLGKDNVQSLKNRVKQLETDKKNLKQQINEMTHKLEIEQLEHIN